MHMSYFLLLIGVCGVRCCSATGPGDRDSSSGVGGTRVTLGIDVACRADHQASLVDERGEFVSVGSPVPQRGRGTAGAVVAGPVRAEATVVLEPTRNAWAALAAWFIRRGARVVMVPSMQSADLRAYYFKHAKNDRSVFPRAGPAAAAALEGLRPVSGVGPADPLRRVTRRRASLVQRRYRGDGPPRRPRRAARPRLARCAGQ